MFVKTHVLSFFQAFPSFSSFFESSLITRLGSNTPKYMSILSKTQKSSKFLELFQVLLKMVMYLFNFQAFMSFTHKDLFNSTQKNSKIINKTQILSFYLNSHLRLFSSLMSKLKLNLTRKFELKTRFGLLGLLVALAY